MDKKIRSDEAVSRSGIKNEFEIVEAGKNSNKNNSNEELRQEIQTKKDVSQIKRSKKGCP